LEPEEQERFGITAAARIPGYDPLELGFTKKESRRFAKFVQYAILASDEAMAQAGMDLEKEDLNRFACIYGTGIGGMEIFEHESVVLNTKGAKRVSPLFIPTMIPNMAAGNLSIRYGLKGDCFSIVTACSTGTHCLGEAYRLIRFGLADAALAGGTEEGVTPISLSGFGNLGAITKEGDITKASRPFDINRSGFVPGEGAGALVIESLEHAQARGAKIIAEITGFGSTGDAHHITAPEPSGEGAVRAMKQALEEGGFTPEDLGHLNAHGTSTHVNDKTESAALYGLAGKRAAEIPVTSIKGAMGHTLGAAGALEAIATALSVANSVVPPTVGFAEADPECNVRVSNEAVRNYPQKVALSNSLGFGGHNASVAISPFSE
jgi:3-oxoacyl-[acyl-carrier-protein] synthase II